MAITAVQTWVLTALAVVPTKVLILHYYCPVSLDGLRPTDLSREPP